MPAIHPVLYSPSKAYRDNSRAVLEHERIKPILEKFKQIDPVLVRQPWLNRAVWHYGMLHAKTPGRHKPVFTAEELEEVLFWNKFGWEVTANPVICAGSNANYVATIEQIEAGLKKILKLVKQKRFLGPFFSLDEVREHFPGKQCKIWPTFYRREDTKFRLLVDLTHKENEDENSFNDNISDEEAEVIYITIKQIVRWIVRARIKFLWAIDAYMAYYSVPIQEQFTPLMGIKLCNMYFFYITLSMGLRSACKIYSSFADVINKIVVGAYPLLWHYKVSRSQKRKDPRLNMIEFICLLKHYMDDFLGGARSMREAKLQVNCILWWWHMLGVPTQPRKITLPNHWVEFIGFTFDCRKHRLGATDKRLSKYTNTAIALRNMMEKNLRLNKGNRLKPMVSAIGEFRSLQIVYPHLVPYFRALEEVVNVGGKKVLGKWVYNKEFVEGNGECIYDLDVIIKRFQNRDRNYIPFDWFLCEKDDCDVTVFTDASTLHGMGGFVDIKDGNWFTVRWQDHIEFLSHFNHSPDITFLELAGLVLAAWAFAPQLRNKKVLFRCDNLASVWIVIKHSACLFRPDLNGLMKVLCKVAYEYNFRPFALHIKGEDNNDADDLSRLFRLLGKKKEKLAPKRLDVYEKTHSLLDQWSKIEVKLEGDDEKFRKRYFEWNEEGEKLKCDCKDMNICNWSKIHQRRLKIDKLIETEVQL